MHTSHGLVSVIHVGVGFRQAYFFQLFRFSVSELKISRYLYLFFTAKTRRTIVQFCSSAANRSARLIL